MVGLEQDDNFWVSEFRFDRCLFYARNLLYTRT